MAFHFFINLQRRAFQAACFQVEDDFARRQQLQQRRFFGRGRRLLQFRRHRRREQTVSLLLQTYFCAASYFSPVAIRRFHRDFVVAAPFLAFLWAVNGENADEGQLILVGDAGPNFDSFTSNTRP